jgi:hypothetical protein
MIVEYTYSQSDLGKRCFECCWLERQDDFNGECLCPHNKIRNHFRNVTDKACSYKNFVMGEDGKLRYVSP